MIKRTFILGLFAAIDDYVELRVSPNDPRARPFARRSRLLDIVPLVAEVVLIGAALVFGDSPSFAARLVAVIGGFLCLPYGIRAIARLIIPRGWARTEAEFLALFNWGTYIEGLLWLALIWAIVLGSWLAAAILGAVHAITYCQFVGGVLAEQWINARRNRVAKP